MEPNKTVSYKAKPNAIVSPFNHLFLASNNHKIWTTENLFGKEVSHSALLTRRTWSLLGPGHISDSGGTWSRIYDKDLEARVVSHGKK